MIIHSCLHGIPASVCELWNQAGKTKLSTHSIMILIFIQDFEALLSAGVNLTGKIALARYGEVYRGIKVSLASWNSFLHRNR